jgi:hypothetical protein
VHDRFPDLLSSSRLAWQSVAVKTRDASPLGSVAASSRTLSAERDAPKATKRRSVELKTLLRRMIPGQSPEKETRVDERGELQSRRSSRMPKILVDGFRRLGCHGCIII